MQGRCEGASFLQRQSWPPWLSLRTRSLVVCTRAHLHIRTNNKISLETKNKEWNLVRWNCQQQWELPLRVVSHSPRTLRASVFVGVSAEFCGNLAGGLGRNEGTADKLTEKLWLGGMCSLMETPPTVNKEEGLGSPSRLSLSGSSPGGMGGSYGFQFSHTLASLFLNPWARGRLCYSFLFLWVSPR